MLLKITALILIAACASASDLSDPTRPPESHLKAPEPDKVAVATRLELSFTRSGVDGATARINGASVSEGDSVAGRLVESIEHGRVVLSGDDRCVITMVEQIKGGVESVPECDEAAGIESTMASQSAKPQPRRQTQSAGNNAIKSYCARIFDSYELQERCIKSEQEARTEYKRSYFDDDVRSYCNGIFDSWELRARCAEGESSAKARLGS